MNYEPTVSNGMELLSRSTFEPRSCELAAVSLLSDDALPNDRDLRRLRSFGALKQGWDSHNAKAIDPRTIELAVCLVRVFHRENIPLPHAVPTPVGGVQLEWETSKVGVEVELNPNGKILFLWENKESGEYVENEIEMDFGALMDSLHKLSPSDAKR